MCFYISRPSRSHFRSRTPFHTRSHTRSRSFLALPEEEGTPPKSHNS